MRKFQKIRFDELADIIFAVLFLELLIERDYVRALHHFLADLECILIRLVDLIELLHEIQLAVLGSLVVGAIVSGVDHLFLLVSPDHSKILYNNMSYQSFLLGFEELALDAVEVELQLVALIEGFLVLGDDVVYVLVDLLGGGTSDLGSRDAFWSALTVEFVEVF